MTSTRILLVDTRPERAQVLRPSLRAEGLDVVACIAPEDDLLAAIRRHDPDLVLIDIVSFRQGCMNPRPRSGSVGGPVLGYPEAPRCHRPTPQPRTS